MRVRLQSFEGCTPHGRFEGSSIAGGALDAIDGFQLELKQEEYFES